MAKTKMIGNKNRHRNSDPYCKKCKKSFIRWTVYKEHKRIQHSKRKEKIVCPLWPKCKSPRNKDGLYANKSNLKTHFSKHHKKVNFDELDPETFTKVFLRKKPYSSNDSDSDYGDDDLIPLKVLADRNESDSGDKFTNDTINSSTTSDSNSSVQRPRHRVRQIASSSDDFKTLTSFSSLGQKPTSEEDSDEFTDDETASTVSKESLVEKFLNAQKKEIYKKRVIQKMDWKEATATDDSDNSNEGANINSEFTEYKSDIGIGNKTETVESDTATNLDENVPVYTNEGANDDSGFAEDTSVIEISIKIETVESDTAINLDENVPVYTNKYASIDNEFAEGTFDTEIDIKTEAFESKPMSHIDSDATSNDDELQHSSENLPGASDTNFRKILDFTSLGIRPAIKNESNEFNDDGTASTDSKELLVGKILNAQRSKIHVKREIQEMNGKKATATVPVLVDYPITFSSDDDDEQNEIGASPSQQTVAMGRLSIDTGDVKESHGESFSTILVDTHSDEKRNR